MLFYIAGPYSDNDPDTVNQNILNARRTAIAVWENGHYAICPHQNTAHFQVDCELDPEKYLDGYIEILKRCDAAIFIPGWEHSRGCLSEKNICIEHDIPYFLLATWPTKAEWKFYLEDLNLSVPFELPKRLGS